MGWVILAVLVFLFLILYTAKNIKEAYHMQQDKNIFIKGIKALFLGIICTIIDGL